MDFDFNKLFDKKQEPKRRPIDKLQEREKETTIQMEMLLSKKKPYIPNSSAKNPSYDLKDKGTRNRIIDMLIDKSSNLTKTDNECILFNNGIYIGQVERRRPSGFGLMIFDNFDLYFGGFHNSKFEGVGFYHYRRGDFYFSEFKQGKCNGLVFWTSGTNSYTKGTASNGVIVKARINDANNKVSEFDYRDKVGGSKNNINTNRSHRQMKSRILEDTEKVEMVKLNKQYVKKKINSIDSPKDIQRYLKQFCLAAKEYEFNRIDNEIFLEKGNNIIDFEKKLDQKFNDLFNKNHFVVKDNLSDYPLYMGVDSIGTVFMPKAKIYHGIFIDKTISMFCYALSANGEFDFGFLENTAQSMGDPYFSGFGMRFYKKMEYLVCGFIDRNTLNGYYLLEHQKEDIYKFALFHNNELKKVLFSVNKAFDWKRLFNSIAPFMILNLSIDFHNLNRIKIAKDFIEKKKVKKRMSKSINPTENYENMIICYFIDMFCRLPIDLKQVKKKNPSEYQRIGSEILERLEIKRKETEMSIKTSKSVPIHSRVVKGEGYSEIRKSKRKLNKTPKKSPNLMRTFEIKPNKTEIVKSKNTIKSYREPNTTKLLHTSKYMEGNKKETKVYNSPRNTFNNNKAYTKSERFDLPNLKRFMESSQIELEQRPMTNTYENKRNPVYYQEPAETGFIKTNLLKSKGFMKDESEDEGITDSQINFVEMSEDNEMNETFDITVGRFYPTTLSVNSKAKNTMKKPTKPKNQEYKILNNYTQINTVTLPPQDLDFSKKKDLHSQVTWEDNKIGKPNNYDYFKVRPVNKIDEVFSIHRNSQKERRQDKSKDKERERYKEELGFKKLNNVLIYKKNDDDKLNKQINNSKADIVTDKISTMKLKGFMDNRKVAQERDINYQVKQLYEPKPFEESKVKSNYFIQDQIPMLNYTQDNSYTNRQEDIVNESDLHKTLPKPRNAFERSKEKVMQKMIDLEEYVKQKNKPKEKKIIEPVHVKQKEVEKKKTGNQRSILNDQMARFELKKQKTSSFGNVETIIKNKTKKKKMVEKKRKSETIPIISQDINRFSRKDVFVQTSEKIKKKNSIKNNFSFNMEEDKRFTFENIPVQKIEENKEAITQNNVFHNSSKRIKDNDLNIGESTVTDGSGFGLDQFESIKDSVTELDKTIDQGESNRYNQHEKAKPLSDFINKPIPESIKINDRQRQAQLYSKPTKPIKQDNHLQQHTGALEQIDEELRISEVDYDEEGFDEETYFKDL